jgi:nucleotide exchange factor SIL1
MYFLKFCTIFAILNSLFIGITSASDKSEIICHGTDCYPKVFKATQDFQTVREDQSIPPGLHVRLNLETGLKEAKLYDGIDDPSLNAVEIFEDGSHNVIEPVPSPAEGLDNFVSEFQKVLKPEVDHGVIRPPPSGPDGQIYQKARDLILKEKYKNDHGTPDDKLLLALEELEDLTHDIYWGLQLAKDKDIVKRLVSFVSRHLDDVVKQGLSARILGNAMQNNPAALSAIFSHKHDDSSSPIYSIDLMAEYLEKKDIDPKRAIPIVYLISETCQDFNKKREFMLHNVADNLRVAFDDSRTGADESDRLRQKISNLIFDRFLQPDSFQDFQSNGSESSWVYVNEDTKKSPSEKEVLQHIPSYLASWCNPFSKSLERWKKGYSKGEESKVAQNHVEEAYKALEERLQSYGCSCDTTEKCKSGL